MKTVWVLPIEPEDTRYTEQWHRHVPEQLRRAAVQRGVDAKVEQIDGVMPEGRKPLAGAFLDFSGTNVFKSTQIAEVAKLFRQETIKAGDVFLITDAWHPGVHQIRYMSTLMRKPVTIVGLWHAGHYDPNDLLGGFTGTNARWAKAFERALFEAYDISGFATGAHADLFRKGVGVAEEDQRVVQVGWPMEYLEEELRPYLGVPKENIVLFPHRLSPEKQPDTFSWLAGELAAEFPNWEFRMAQNEELDKDEYHRLLARSRVVFSASLQETLGIGCYEGVLAGAVPVVPDRLSYTEMYPKEFRYPSAWTEPREQAIFRLRLVAHMRAILERASRGQPDLSACKQQLAPFFSGERLYDEVFG